jgi:hypothetical protein
MIYLAMIYLLFQINYDLWGSVSPHSTIIYFAFQYGWIACLFLLLATKGKNKIIYLVLSVTYFIITIFELTKWNLNPTLYDLAVSPPAVTGYSIAIIILLGLLLLLKNIQWERLKKIGRGFYL